MDRSDAGGGGNDIIGTIASSTERDAAFEHLQEIFKGKLDADVVYMVCRDNNWKVNETFEKLLLLSAELEQQARGGNQLQQTSTQIQGRPSSLGNASSAKLSLHLHSRLPPSTEPTMLPMLSPKTPSVAMNYPQFDRQSSTTDRMTSAMAALDSYAMHAESPGITELYPTQRSPQPMYKGGEEGEGSKLVETKRDAVSGKVAEKVWPGYDCVVPDRNGPSPHHVDFSQKKRVFRKKAYSLNPEEREALEDLIQNVIIDGVDDEAMDSDDSTSPGDSETQPIASGGEDTEEKDSTVYPPQLKVAVKHMKNLPPRFLKKIHISPRPSEINLPPTPEGDAEDAELKFGPRVGIKKTIRSLMDGLDSYIDDGVELVEEVHVEVPETEPWPSSTSGRPGAVSCADLEREMFAGAGVPPTQQVAPLAVSEEKAMRFSVDAPEFVPRAYTPSTSPNSQLHAPPPPPSNRVGRHSPAPVPPAPRVPAPVVPPTFVIPKVSAYASMTTNITQHSGVVLGVPYQPYASAATLLPSAYVSTPLRQPYRSPPGFTDKTRMPAAAGIQYPFVPLYVSPTMSGLSPAMVARQAATNSMGHWTTPLVGYVVSPHSSPKAMRRVMQPHLIPAQMAASQCRLADLTGTGGIPLGAGVQYRCSPQSSPKVHRRVPTEDGVIAATKQRVLDAIKTGSKLLVILRGCAGSGKSTLARELQAEGVVLTTDDFFKKDGVYNYNKSKLAEAHEWNRKRAKECLDAGVTPVIIDNTNSQSWEMKYYVMQALKADYHVELLEPSTAWRYNAAQLAERNGHGVSIENIQRMLDRFEHHVTINAILRSAPAPGDEVESPMCGGTRLDDTQEATPKRSTRRRRRKRGKRDRAKRRPAGDANGDTSNDGERADGDISSDDDDEPQSSLSPSPAVVDKPVTTSESGGSSVADVVSESSVVTEMSSPSLVTTAGDDVDASRSQFVTTTVGDTKVDSRQTIVAPLCNGHFVLQFAGGDTTDDNVSGGSAVALKKVSTEHSNGDAVPNHLSKCIARVTNNDAEVGVGSSHQVELVEDAHPALLRCGTDGNCAAEMLTMGKPLRQPCDTNVQSCRSVLNGCASFDSPVGGHAAVTRTFSHTVTKRSSRSPEADFWSTVDDDDDCCPWTTLTAATSAPSTPRAGLQQNPIAPLQHCATDSMLLVDDLQRKLGGLELRNADEVVGRERRDAVTCTNGAADSSGLGVLMARSRDINSVTTIATPSASNANQHAGCLPRFDKGCATTSPTSLQRALSSGDGNAVLHRRFPTVAVDDLEHILETCGADVDWAANVLLDAGYEYCEVDEQIKEGETVEVTSPAVEVVTALSDNDNDDVLTIEVVGVPSLLCLCHAVLTTVNDLTSERLHETLADGSLRRMRDISAFRMARLPTPAPSVTLNVTLTSELAAQLCAMFGPVHSMADGDDGGATIRLDVVTARHLHRCWASAQADVLLDGRTDGQGRSASDTEQDEYLARILQEEEELACLLDQPPRMDSPSHAAWGGVDVADIAFQRPAKHPKRQGGVADRGVDSLQEIMDEELAIERSNRDQVRQTQTQRDSLSTKLKRQRLREIFLKVDEAVLEDVFQTSRYSFETTVRSLQEMYGTAGAIQRATPEPRPADDATDDSWQAVTMSHAELASFDYRAVREEASLHARLRHQCFHKAERAHRHKMAAVAAFYAQQGRLHADRMREANRVAAVKIMAYRASTQVLPDNHIDLHGLSVDEAIAALRYSIASWEKDTRRPASERKAHLYVMTGRGSHSQGGVARIRPAVINYLNRHKYRYSQPNEGVLKVQLQYRAAK